MDFRHQAACRDHDPELWFPIADPGPVHDAQAAEAKGICGGCPVRAQCLTWALGVQEFGVAGGLTEHERRALRARALRERRRPARPAGAGLAHLPTGRPVGSELGAAGRAALRSGRHVIEVARELGVHQRSAERWATEIRAGRTD